MINIGGDENDASYRYKMPRLLTKIEGRGNGIKTVIVNMVDIAKSLHVDPAYPTKYFGIDLGAQSKFNAKTDKAVVNGCFESKDMAKILNKFIDDFVLCPTCRYPEIKMIVKKDRIKIDCAACGHNGVINTKHKLVTYILKDHSDAAGGKKSKKEKKGGKEGKKKKKKGEEGEVEEEEEQPEQPKEVGEDGEVVAKAAKKTKEEEGEVEWLTDTSKEAQKNRKAEEFANMKANEFLKDVEDIIQNADGDQSASTVLKIFLASNKRTTMEIVSEVKRLQLSRGLDEPQKMKVLLEAVIDLSDMSQVASEYTKHAALLKKFASDKQTATILLNCLEEQVGVVEPRLLNRTPLLLQALYEADVLEEEVIMSWYESPPESSWLVNKDVAVAVRRKALPFVKWLQEADEEDDDE